MGLRFSALVDGLDEDIDVVSSQSSIGWKHVRTSNSLYNFVLTNVLFEVNQNETNQKRVIFASLFCCSKVGHASQHKLRG